MKFSRRRFLSGSSVLLLSTTSPLYAKMYLQDGQQGSADHGGLPILQGRTDRTSASIIIQHPDDPKIFVRAEDEHGTAVPLHFYDSFGIPGVKHHISEYTARGLSPEKNYRLTVTDDSGQVLDRRDFRSLDTDKEKCRIAVASCMNDSGYFTGFSADAVQAWRQLAAQQPDLVILTGDTCYADQNMLSLPILFHSKERLAERYFETRSRLSWFRHRRLIPTIATWDDHDFGTNNGNKNFHLKSDVKFLFEVFWGRRENAIHKNGPGVGSYISAFGQRFFLMDDRSFRDPDAAKASYWGETQKDRLLAKIGEAETPAWIVNGNQFFGGYLKKESFEHNYRSDFKDFLAKLKKQPAPVAFASGDVHFSEVMELEPAVLGYKTYEFTSSSIHSFGSHHHGRKNPRRIAKEEKHNFLVLDIDVAKNWRIDCRCFRTTGEPAFFTSQEIVRG